MCFSAMLCLTLKSRCHFSEELSHMALLYFQKNPATHSKEQRNEYVWIEMHIYTSKQVKYTLTFRAELIKIEVH